MMKVDTQRETTPPYIEQVVEFPIRKNNLALGLNQNDIIILAAQHMARWRILP